jgi:DNA invertase Pin-like site-specific DNA recombinase
MWNAALQSTTTTGVGARQVHQGIVYEPRAKGVILKATEQPISTGTAAEKFSLGMFGVFAEFQPKLQRKLQLESTAKVKAAGIYRVWKPQSAGTKSPQLNKDCMSPAAIAKQLGFG